MNFTQNLLNLLILDIFNFFVFLSVERKISWVLIGSLRITKDEDQFSTPIHELDLYDLRIPSSDQLKIFFPGKLFVYINCRTVFFFGQCFKRNSRHPSLKVLLHVLLKCINNLNNSTF